MSNFSWRVNGVPKQAIGGPFGIPEAAPGVPAEQPSADQKDAYLQKITKIIPVEIVGAYALAMQFSSSAPENERLGFLTIVLILGVVGTVATMTIPRGLYRPKAPAGNPTGPKTRDRHELVQIILAIGAFLVFAYVDGGAFALGPTFQIPLTSTVLWPYSAAAAGLLVVVYGFVLGLFDPPPVVDTKA